MSATKKIIILAIILQTILHVNGVNNYTDENRPYEFGFSIDGEQHRHEKKDENGIIMGEFGFITADGVYHVTVYATDEQGRFKILSMKNIRVKPYPTAAAQNSRTGHSLSLADPQKDVTKPSNVITAPSFEAKPQPQITSQNHQNSKVSSFQLPPASPVRSCSHCSLPTTTTVAPKYPNPISYDLLTNEGEQNSNQYNNNHNLYQGDRIGQTGVTNSQQVFNEPSSMKELNSGVLDKSGVQPNAFDNRQINRPSFGINNNPSLSNQGAEHTQDHYPNINTSTNYDDSAVSSLAGQNQQMLNKPSNGNNNQDITILRDTMQSEQNRQGSYHQDTLQNSQENPQKQPEGANNLAISGSRIPKRYEPTSAAFVPQNGVEGMNRAAVDVSNLPEVPPKSPMLFSAQMQIVDKNTDIYHKNPGESDGLPEGVTKDYMEHVLYVFNYTVGFHGHFETGYSNGAKQGYYYVTGRNGVRTRVDYEADEKGFRPKISQEVLDILSDDVPKPETEKEPKYGLKSYEFKWLYFPVESKQQK